MVLGDHRGARKRSKSRLCRKPRASHARAHGAVGQPQHVLAAKKMTPGCGDQHRASFGSATRRRRSHFSAKTVFVRSVFRETAPRSTGSVSFANCPAASFFEDSFWYSLISSWWSLTIDFANELSNQEPESTFSFA